MKENITSKKCQFVSAKKALIFFTFFFILDIIEKKIFIFHLQIYMYKTLEDLEIQAEYEAKRRKKSPLKKLFWEIKVLFVIFILIFLWMYVVTNAQLLIDSVQDRVAPQTVQTFSQETTHSNVNLLSQQREKQKELDMLVEKYSDVVSLEKEIAPSMDQLLRERLNSYDFGFNLLPPTNRLVIPSINLDVPLVHMKMKDYEDFSAGTFDTELENWVVKYPTTPNPGAWGNAFFFGHTSQEYRKYNKYGTVFRNIPQLVPGDRIQVVREGELYEYRVVTTKIVSPRQVNETYMEYANLGKEYITLMWCYPIGRADKRMMVFAEIVQ